MSDYPLVDGSLSSQYKIGDKFVYDTGTNNGTFSDGSIIEFLRDDGTDCPKFKLVEGSGYAVDPGYYSSWKYMLPYKEESTPQETPLGKQLFGHKIKVQSEEHSRLIQEVVLAAGGEWYSGAKHVQYLNNPYIFITKVGIMTISKDIEIFYDRFLPELKTEVVSSLKIIGVVGKEKSEQEKKMEELQKIIDNLQLALDNAQNELKQMKEK